jgi:uncharacterized membrane protein
LFVLNANTDESLHRDAKANLPIDERSWQCVGRPATIAEAQNSSDWGDAMKWLKTISRWIFGLLFVLAGVNHFVNPGFYLKIMPPYLPLHLESVYVSGVFEIVLGALLLFKRWAWLAGWGLILLLIAIFPANIYVYQHQELIPGTPILHLLRLPLQGVLILWAYWYTRPDRQPLGASPKKSEIV